MSATTALAIVMVAWLACGVVTGTAMGRRGHDAFTWLLLGATLGPLVVPLALSTHRRTGPTQRQSLEDGRRSLLLSPPQTVGRRSASDPGAG